MSFSDEFKSIYMKKYGEFLYKNNLKRKLFSLKEQFNLLCAAAPNFPDDSGMTNMIVGNSMNRISITNIGSFPLLKYTSSCLFPIGFTSKRRFKPYKAYKKTMKDKVLYICSIKPDGISIVSEDGHEWKGEDFWERFVEDAECSGEFKGFEEFSGLTHPNVIKCIENLGDISQFKGYVPLEKRGFENIN